MDVREYYERIRQIEASTSEEEVVVVSLSTPDGGRAGVRREVKRELAARLIAEGRARMADEKEAAEHRSQLAADYAQAEQQSLLGRTQLAILPESELRALKHSLRVNKS
ncbi:MAG: hypothetical protein SFV54_20935 [Bryobacteraceae bacterium]|nr:hypothetical protein [Bryobacteraceae bacterium]